MSDSSLKKGRFTKFSNRIGLYSNQSGNYIANAPEVVLNFPFKDTVLEGGMTKEDAGRDERFLHLEIDKKDIDTLEDPKVLTNFKYIDQNGETNLTANSDIEFFSEDGNLTQNLLIKGNNLLALYSLREKLAGKVKLIYIDPPFNTGSDSFGYNDKFRHSSWLTFMKNRLEVAKGLVSENGAIVIHLDENESGYLRVLCDEIFGANKLLNEIIWHYKSFVGQVKTYFPKKHDTLLVYGNPDQIDFIQTRKNVPIEEMSDFKNWGKYIVNKNEIRGDYYPSDVRFKRNVDKWLRNHPGKTPGKEDVLYVFQSQPVDDVWTDIDYLDPKNKTERVNFSGGQKPEALLQRIIQSYTKEGETVLDYHLGSGTTSAVAHKMNRRWVGIEQMDYIETVSKERLKKVVDGEQGGISKDVNWQGGGSFVYMELKKYNQDFLDRLMEVTSIADVEAVYEDMQKNAFLKFFFDKREFEKDENFRSKTWEERRDMLVDILDENQLYLNLQDMRDAKHKVSNDEMSLTERFYGVKENGED